MITSVILITDMEHHEIVKKNANESKDFINAVFVPVSFEMNNYFFFCDAFGGNLRITLKRHQLVVCNLDQSQRLW